MAMPLWVVGLIKKTFPLVRTVARLTNVPGLGRLIELGLFEGDDIMYLPKDRVISIDRPVEAAADTVLPSQVVDHFIKEAGFIWIMDTCICRESLDCQDYPHDLGCLFLGEAARGINPRLGRQVTSEEALEHAARCREAGLVHLIGRNKLDSVWLNVRPGEKLLTICNCCPCCCLWRIVDEITPRISEKLTRMPTVSVKVTDRCVGCGACLDNVCFAQAIALKDGRAEIGEACRGCGRCVETCPNQAIEISFELPAAIQTSIDRLARVVDVN